MAKSEHEIRVTPSVFDRLVDNEPGNSRDPFISRAESVREFRRSVQRDLEHLLNTRNPLADLEPEFDEVGKSVLAYGLPDFSALNIGQTSDQARLRQLVENSIRNFEPRLTGVAVSVLSAEKGADSSQAARIATGTLRLRIDARLRVDPGSEPVTFDVIMPLSTQKYEVRGAD